MNALPIAIEALGPCIERQRVMPAKIFDVENLEPGVFHQRNRIGETWNPTAGKNIISNKELGFTTPDVADEMQHSKPAGL